jgi:hypothetical protein
MAGEHTVRDVLETLIKGLCSAPGAAAVRLQQQPGVSTILLVAAANPVDTGFLQGGDLFESLRIVTAALGQQQHSSQPCDFAIAQAGGVGGPPMPSAAPPAGAGPARGMAAPVPAAAPPAKRAKARNATPAPAKSAAKQAPRRRPVAAPTRRSKPAKKKG